MKLISELVEEVQYLSESTKDGTKNYFIEGVFLQGNIKNRNGRVYPINVLEKEVNRYSKEYIDKKRAYGELGHPQGPTINLERVSHLITSLKRDGDNYIGRAKIMTETPYGKIVKSLLDEGAQLGVSSRGMGSLKQRNGLMEVQDDYYLATAGDVVADPSAPQALVRGIMENVEWVYDESLGWKAVEVAENFKKEVHENKKKLNEDTMLDIFNRFITKL